MWTSLHSLYLYKFTLFKCGRVYTVYMLTNYMLNNLNYLYTKHNNFFIFGLHYTFYKLTSLHFLYVELFINILCEQFYTLHMRKIYNVYMSTNIQCLYMDQFTLFMFGLVHIAYICSLLHCLYLIKFTLFMWDSLQR